MSEQEFNDKSDAALRVTRALMDQMDLSTFGIDEIGVFNHCAKGARGVGGQQ